MSSGAAHVQLVGPGEHHLAWPNIAINAYPDPGPGLQRSPGRGGAISRSSRWTGQHQQTSHSGSGGGVQRAQRTCGVCGDRARSLHFGGLSCDSCKAFFRRAVQSSAYKNFQCPHQATNEAGWTQFCVINISSRKSCQKCRFERCVEIGMEVSWVMSEAERQRLLNIRLAKRRKVEAEQTPSTTGSSPPAPLPPANPPLQDYLWPLKPDTVPLETFMTPEEASSVLEVRSAWMSALQQLPPTQLEGMDLNQPPDHKLIVRSMTGSVQRFRNFAQPLLERANMLDRDKKALLQGSMLEMCILRGAMNHVRGAMLFERFFPERLHNIHCRFVRGLQELALDQTTLLLFLMVILINPERTHLAEPHTIEKIQEYYLMLLNKYIGGRYGLTKASTLYPKLLSKMADLRELNDCHQEQNLLLAQHEVKTMQLELSRIQQNDKGFEAPQSFQQLSPEPTTPTTPTSYSQTVFFPQSKSIPISSPAHSAYTPAPSLPSPCDSVSSSGQRFFGESSPEDLYMPAVTSSFEERDHVFSTLQCIPGPDIGDVMALQRPQDFSSYCIPLQPRATALNGLNRYQYYDPPGLFPALHEPSLERPVGEGEGLFGEEDECHALVQQCLQDGGFPAAALQTAGVLPLSPPPSSGSADGSFSEYTTLHDVSAMGDAFLVYHR